MALVPSSSNRWGLNEIMKLPPRLSDDMLASLQSIVNTPVEDPEPCTPEYLSKALMGMDAVLPRQGKDAVTGAVMMKTYTAKLSKFPKGAIAHLWNKSVEQCEWFPTVAECLRMANEWVDGARMLVHARSVAASRINRERDHRFNDAIEALKAGTMSQADVDKLPEAWRKIAVEKGYLWHLKDGTYRPRPNTWGMTAEQLEHHRAMVDQLREEGLL